MKNVFLLHGVLALFCISWSISSSELSLAERQKRAKLESMQFNKDSLIQYSHNPAYKTLLIKMAAIREIEVLSAKNIDATLESLDLLQTKTTGIDLASNKDVLAQLVKVLAPHRCTRVYAHLQPKIIEYLARSDSQGAVRDALSVLKKELVLPIDVFCATDLKSRLNVESTKKI